MRTRRFHGWFALAAIVAAGGCGSPTGTVWSEAVRVAAHADRVEITNLSDRTIYTFVIGPAAMPLVDWIPCIGPGCGMVDPGTTRTEPHSALLVSDSDKVVHIYWWHATTGLNRELRPGPVRVITASIPGR